jgi:4-diphosphocytidyl-2-C-methyl-D-erythritol kinase
VSSTPLPDTLEKLSPCKVNLLLNILGKRADGFHELETVMHPIALCDRLEFTRTGIGVNLTCSEPGLPADASNLVHRAATAFLSEAGLAEQTGLHIHLEKRIPMAAGLGGGSANAATTLSALNQMFGEPLDGPRLQKTAAALGSDVPFFLQQSPALATGRGERIESLKPLSALAGTALLLVHPGFGIATAWAYRALARFPDALHGQAGRARRLLGRLEAGDLTGAAAEFYNSLEAPALEKHPLLGLYQEFLKAQGAAATLMSGSGSTVFAIAHNEASARELEARLQAKFGPCWSAVVGWG